MARSDFFLFFFSGFLGAILIVVAVREQKHQEVVDLSERLYVLSERLYVLSETLWQERERLVQEIQKQDVQRQKLEAEVQRMTTLLFNCLAKMKLMEPAAGTTLTLQKQPSFGTGKFEIIYDTKKARIFNSAFKSGGNSSW